MNATFDCWKVLELPGRTDERSVKRQYARLLKIRRPEEDPEAFQHLREAYEHALQIVREDDDHEAPVSDLTAAPVAALPMQVARPAVRSAFEQATVLLDKLDDAAPDQCWNEASARGIEAVFERLLFERCVNAPHAHPILLNWGIEQRQWLTPWQQIRPREHEQQRLTHWLAITLNHTLDQYMSAGNETHFFECLERHSRQGWLGELSRRQGLQVHVLNLFLSDETWSPDLFQKVRQLFAWDVESAVVPIADEHWRALQRRAQLQVWLSELHQQALQRERHPSATANAAALFLSCAQPAQQKAMTAAFSEPDWQACERLAVTFTERFPDLLGMFPNHNVWFWKSFIDHKGPPHGLKRTAIVLTLTLVLSSLPSSDPALMLILLPLYALGGWLAACVGKWFISHWYVIAENLNDLDQRASAWCMRHKLTTDRRYLVIRNSGPLLALGFVIWSWLGILGLGTYVLIGVIGVLQAPTAIPTDREYRWRRPLQAIYRIAGLSWLQWGVCLAMLFVIGYVQIHLPGSWLTHREGW
nr:hypothetical protein [uncultured Pseudomonas sp.]